MDKFGTSDSTEKLILMCVDASKDSARSFNWYYKHFYRNDHTIGFAHIYTKPDDGQCRETARELLKRSESITHTFQEACAHRGIKSCVLSEEKIDTVGNTICIIAKKTQAACIVMGQRRSMCAIKRAVMGNVGDYVLHHAHVTVLVVPASENENN